MQIEVKDLTHSLVTTGSLVPAIDRIAVGKEYPSPLLQCPVSWNVTIPPTMLKRLMDSPNNKLKQMGIYALLLELDRGTEGNRGEVIVYLTDMGISFSKIQSAIRWSKYAGHARQLRSRPEIGRHYRALAIQRKQSKK